jgi:hypothetical protein
MKKVLLTFICMLGVLFAAQANTITIVNLTGCSCSFSFRGLGDPNLPGTYYESPYVTITPGNTVYASPSMLPGMSGLPAGAIFKQIKGGVVSTLAGTSLACGTADWGPTSMSTLVGVPCNNNNMVTASWQQNTAGNVVVLIM